MSASSDDGLDDDTLAKVADLRARGRQWNVVAERIGWDEEALLRAVRHSPRYDRAYEWADRELHREAAAEARAALRRGMRDNDADRRHKAAVEVMKGVAAERRDRTRLEVETLRADAARAKLAAKVKRADDEEPEDAVPPASGWGPEVVHRPDTEGRIARRAADDKATVWLWGGMHPVGGRLADPASDIPLVLFQDDTVRGRTQYWATTYPLPGLPTKDHCPGAAGDVPALTPEQAAQLEALAARGAPAA